MALRAEPQPGCDRARRYGTPRPLSSTTEWATRLGHQELIKTETEKETLKRRIDRRVPALITSDANRTLLAPLQADESDALGHWQAAAAHYEAALKVFMVWRCWL